MGALSDLEIIGRHEGAVPIWDVPSDYRTPYTDAAERTVGSARLSRSFYDPLFLYRMEGMGGFEYFRPGEPLPCMALEQIGDEGDWRVWMVDDPTHWIGTRELCGRMPAGRVLCAGLGLGLMVHHLVARDDITAVRVVEMSQDVIDLVRPHLPADPRVEIVCDDYYSHIAKGGAAGFDSIFWDLAVGDPQETRGEFVSGYASWVMFAQHARLFQFGLRDGGDHLFGKWS